MYKITRVKHFFGKSFFLLLLAAISVAACKTEKKEKRVVNQQLTEEKLAQKPKQQERKFEYPIPTPFEVTIMLNKAQASYIAALSNNIENAEKYIAENKKAVNLGIFGSDLSYASTYNKTENTRLYMSVVQEITEDIGISSAVNSSIIERAERNIHNADSLNSIISSSYYDTFDFLNQHGKGAISVLVLAGGWIEGLYISTQLAKTAQNKPAIYKGIAKQKATYDELSVLLRAYKDKNTSVSEIFDEIGAFKEVYEQVEEEETMTVEQVEKLTEIVDKLRTKIVGA